MEIKAKFDHYNCNVLNLEKSLNFYEKALGFKIHRQIKAEDGSFVNFLPKFVFIMIKVYFCPTYSPIKMYNYTFIH